MAFWKKKKEEEATETPVEEHIVVKYRPELMEGPIEGANDEE